MQDVRRCQTEIVGQDPSTILVEIPVYKGRDQVVGPPHPVKNVNVTSVWSIFVYPSHSIWINGINLTDVIALFVVKFSIGPDVRLVSELKRVAWVRFPPHNTAPDVTNI